MSSFRWALVASVMMSTAPALAQEKSPSVHVVVDADAHPVTLVQIVESRRQDRAEQRTTPICAAPCQADLDPNGRFRVSGRGVTNSSMFSLPPDRPLHLHVSAGRRAQRIAGLWTLLSGLTIAVAGGATVGLDMLSLPGLYGAAQPNQGAMTAGIAMLVGGAVTLLVGALVFAGGDTSVRTAHGAVLARARAPVPRLTVAGLVF